MSRLLLAAAVLSLSLLVPVSTPVEDATPQGSSWIDATPQGKSWI